MAEPEELLRTSLNWAKENGYSIERGAVYDKRCDGIQALLQHKKSEGLTSSTEILGVTSEWIRAFQYGFSGSLPRLKGGDGIWGGIVLQRPDEAFQLGQKLGLEFCGPTPWKFAI